jgi:lysophospholipase L1-like esterase
MKQQNPTKTRRLRTILYLALGAMVLLIAFPWSGEAQEPSVREHDISIAQSGQVPSDIAYPALAFDSRGLGWLVWEQTGDFAGRYDSEIFFSRQQGDTWSPPTPVVADPAAWDHAPALAADRQGRIWVAWSRSTGTDDAVWVARWQNGAWVSLGQVSPDGVVSRFPSLAVGPDGSVWLAWSGRVHDNYELFVRRWNGQDWEAPVQLTHDVGADSYDWAPRIAVSDANTVWIAWPRHEPSSDDSIFVISRTNGLWSQPTRVGTPDDGPDDAVTLALDPDGRPWLAWVGWDGATGLSTLLAAHLTDLGWTSERSLPTNGRSVRDPVLVFDRSGGAHLAWSSGRFLAYSRRVNGAWTAPRLVSGTRLLPTALAMTVDDQGRLALAWSSSPDTFRLRRFAVADLPASLPAEKPVLGLAPAAVQPAAVVGRLVAFGDSITYGGYNAPNTYPALLEQRIDDHVYPSEVVNEGVPGEWSSEGLARLDGVLNTWDPQYLLVMEGTNDISHYRSSTPGRVTINLGSMIDEAKKRSVKGLLATIPPRTDDKEDETEETNARIRSLASEHHYILADQWAALTAYPGWENYMQNYVHPSGPLMEVVANTWYDAFLSLPWINEDTVPPSSSVVALPISTEGPAINLSWAGTDSGNSGSTNLGTGIAVYDVQVRDGPTGSWTAWLTETPDVSRTYMGQYGHTYYFRSRARDRAGNWEAYDSDQGDTFTLVTDTTPPDTSVLPLYPYRLGPFIVKWAGSDELSGVASYDIQYRVESDVTWHDWLTNTTATEATFGPSTPVTLTVGQTYYFRSRARDYAGNLESYPSGENGDTWATVVGYGFSGHVYGNRGLPLYGAEIRATEAFTVGISGYDGYYEVYLPSSGDYAVTATQKDAGALPPLPKLTVSSIVTGVDFYLPPVLDSIADGGFESGWNAWKSSGVISPVITTTVHSGQGALLLGAGTGSGNSAASQTPWIPGGLDRPTLAFLYRVGGEGAGALSLTLDGATGEITRTLPLTATAWTHYWVDVTNFAGQNVTIRFSLSREGSGDSLYALIDEVSLGPAMSGPTFFYFPVIVR